MPVSTLLISPRVLILFQVMGIGRGNGPGGARPGAGRPRGSKNKRRPAQQQAAASGQQLPLEYMLQIMNDRRQPSARRDKMAIACAPYLHARLIANGVAKCSFEMTAAELEAVLKREEAYQREQDELARLRRLAELHVAVDNTEG
jgi:hypothetical protein